VMENDGRAANTHFKGRYEEGNWERSYEE